MVVVVVGIEVVVTGTDVVSEVVVAGVDVVAVTVVVTGLAVVVVVHDVGGFHGLHAVPVKANSIKTQQNPSRRTYCFFILLSSFIGLLQINSFI
jgi:hypothetical protein